MEPTTTATITTGPPLAPPASFLPGEKTIVLPQHHQLIFLILRVVALEECCKQRQSTQIGRTRWHRVVDKIFHPETGCARAYSRWKDRDAQKLKKLVFAAINFFDDKSNSKIAGGFEPSELEALASQLKTDIDAVDAAISQENQAARDRQRVNDREERFVGMLPPIERGGVPIPTLPGRVVTDNDRAAFGVLARNPRCKLHLFCI